MTYAEVAHLIKRTDGFLVVKPDLNIKAKRVDKIYNKQKLWICGGSNVVETFRLLFTEKLKKALTSESFLKKLNRIGFVTSFVEVINLDSISSSFISLS